MTFKKKNNGSAFVVVIMTMAVILILATTIATVAASNFGMGQSERRWQSAFFAAEAGMEHQIEHMRTRLAEAHRIAASANPPDLNAGRFFTNFEGAGFVNSPLTFQNLGNDVATATITVTLRSTQSNARVYEIISTGRVGNVTRRLRRNFRVEFQTATQPLRLFDYALFAEGDIDIGGNSLIHGDVGTNAATIDVNNPRNINGNLLVNQNLRLPDITLPDDLSSHGTINTNSDLTINSTASSTEPGGRKHYNRITVRGGGKLTFNLMHGDMIVVTDHIFLNSGEIQITGNGRLFLFLTGHNPIRFNGNDNLINTIDPSDPSRLVIFTNASTLNITGNATINSLLYAPHANLTLGGGSQIDGALMVGTTANVQGNHFLSFTEYRDTIQDTISQLLGIFDDFLDDESIIIPIPPLVTETRFPE